jgi:type IV secretion system protein VirB10
MSFIGIGALSLIAGVAFAPKILSALNLNSEVAKKIASQEETPTSQTTPASPSSEWDHKPNYIAQNSAQYRKVSQQNYNSGIDPSQDKWSRGDMDVATISQDQKRKAEQDLKEKSAPLDADVNQSIAKEQALKAVAKDEDYLETRKRKPKSEYEVKAGSVIPATLQTGLNSDLPGYATAVVRANVFDSVTGNWLLIPKGSKLFGKYDSKISYGQSRLFISWNRIIFEDGTSINIKGMDGTDKEGYAGFNDKVDDHLGSLLGGALLMSVIGAGAQLSQPQNATGNGFIPSQNQTIGNTLAGNAGTQISTIAGQVVTKNMNVQPTIIIRPGYEFNVMVNKDMVLDPYAKLSKSEDNSDNDAGMME